MCIPQNWTCTKLWWMVFPTISFRLHTFITAFEFVHTPTLSGVTSPTHCRLIITACLLWMLAAGLINLWIIWTFQTLEWRSLFCIPFYVFIAICIHFQIIVIGKTEVNTGFTPVIFYFQKLLHLFLFLDITLVILWDDLVVRPTLLPIHDRIGRINRVRVKKKNKRLY